MTGDKSENMETVEAVVCTRPGCRHLARDHEWEWDKDRAYCLGSVGCKCMRFVEPVTESVSALVKGDEADEHR